MLQWQRRQLRLAAFDINRNGDMAYPVNMNSGQAVMLRTADGVDHFVISPAIPNSRATASFSSAIPA
jgi:hypothetical protein